MQAVWGGEGGLFVCNVGGKKISVRGHITMRVERDKEVASCKIQVVEKM
jgi:hypothetical protein